MAKKIIKVECNCDDGYVYYGSGCSMRCDCQTQIFKPKKKVKKKRALSYILNLKIDGAVKNLVIDSIEKANDNTTVKFSYDYLDYSDDFRPYNSVAEIENSDFKNFRKSFATGNLKLITDALPTTKIKDINRSLVS